jgi:DNA-binding NarL/FixJ family response regulator
VAVVVVIAAFPSVRLGLTAMRGEHGHLVRSEQEAPDEAVWVLDAPDQTSLDGLSVRRYADVPRSAVVLADDASQAAMLAHAGLRGWALLARDSGAADLDLAVRAADAGLVLVDLPTAAAVVPAPAAFQAARRDTTEPLTPREVQVLQLVAQGLSNKGIAHQLHITENTAKFHVAALCGKLGAVSRTEAVAIAARRGLIVL